MAIDIVEIHHPAIRMETSGEETLNFYEGLLGLKADPGRPVIPGVPGYWINVGEVGQIHIVGGAQPSTLAKGPGEDPTYPHIALGVRDVQETKKALEAKGVKFWSMTGINGPQAEQLFIHDPTGNMIELHQFDQCRCKVVSRV
jgi:catechol 2,3-dioxygenase-like lactoylglutathione lyase family enzyme